MLVLNTVLHGVGLIVDQLPGVARDVVFEHVLALHVLQLHPEHFDLFQVVFVSRHVLPLQLYPVKIFEIIVCLVSKIFGEHTFTW